MRAHTRTQHFRPPQIRGRAHGRHAGRASRSRRPQHCAGVPGIGNAIEHKDVAGPLEWPISRNLHGREHALRGNRVGQELQQAQVDLFGARQALESWAERSAGRGGAQPLGRVQDGFDALARGERFLQQPDTLYQAQAVDEAVLALMQRAQQLDAGIGG